MPNKIYNVRIVKLLQARHPQHHIDIDDDDHCRRSVDPTRAGDPGLTGKSLKALTATFEKSVKSSQVSNVKCQMSAGHETNL